MTTNIKDIVKALKANKKYEVNLLSDEDSPCVVHDWMSTGCLVLDKIMGGGLPIGRITQIWGAPSSGKSLIGAQIAAWAQSMKYPVLYIDTESAVSITMMQELDVDIDSLIYSSPDTVEQVFQLMEDTIGVTQEKMPGAPLFIVWDSVAATSVEMEMEADYGKANMGRIAQVISQGLRKIARLIAKSNVCVLLLNQSRQNIGVMFGDSDVSPGGNAIEFYSSIIVKLTKSSKIKEGKKVIGMDTRAVCTKNKLAAPFQSCVLPIYFGSAVDDASATLNFLKDVGLVTNSGAYYSILDGIVPSLKEAGLSVPDKFQGKTWGDVYNDYYDTFVELVLNADSFVS